MTAVEATNDVTAAITARKNRGRVRVMQATLEIVSRGQEAQAGLLAQEVEGLLAQEVEARPVIQLEQLHKTYTMGDVEVHALRGVSLNVNEGEFVAIMGASGSGKSTTMNIIGCLDQPTRGSYMLDGQDVSALSKDERADIRSRKLGFVFQGFNLLSRTSALENVELPMLYAGVEASERHRRALEALHSVGLVGREQNHPNQLSGGQQQRVAIARALVNNPSLILADEPTGNLDSRTSIEVLEIFQRLNRERGITLVLVTHEPDIAEYADRVVVFKDGRIKKDYKVAAPRDASEELKNLPAVEDEEFEED
ncbi:MAG: putative transport system ATP-binding protein [Acidobacteriota bacterium]|nr:putative transport system ATP-binding protein [Acidobacteriota bacterium]